MRMSSRRAPVSRNTGRRPPEVLGLRLLARARAIICPAASRRLLEVAGKSQQRSNRTRAAPPSRGQESESAIVRQEDVAGMRIGVEDAVQQNLLQVRLEELVGDRLRIDVGQNDGVERRELGSVDVVHRQDAGGRVVPNGLRNDDAPESGERAPDRFHVARFLPVVELGGERLAELDDHVAKRVIETAPYPAVDELGDFLERFAVLPDPVLDVGTLDLDRDDRPSRSAARCTWPSDAAAVGFSSNIENRGQPRAELVLDDSLHVGERERLDLVLKRVSFEDRHAATGPAWSRTCRA